MLLTAVDRSATARYRESGDQASGVEVTVARLRYSVAGAPEAE